MNVTDALDFFAEERIKIGNEGAGTSTLNQAHYKLQAKKDKAQTRQLLELAKKNFYGQIN